MTTTPDLPDGVTVGRRICENTWQGPSDDECVDDLLTVRCTEFVGHDDLHHGEVDGVAVMWESCAGTLWAVTSGATYRNQF